MCRVGPLPLVESQRISGGARIFSFIQLATQTWNDMDLAAKGEAQFIGGKSHESMKKYVKWLTVPVLSR